MRELFGSSFNSVSGKEVFIPRRALVGLKSAFDVRDENNQGVRAPIMMMDRLGRSKSTGAGGASRAMHRLMMNEPDGSDVIKME